MLNRREAMLGTIAAAAGAALPAADRTTTSYTTTNYSAPFWHYEDVREAWCGCCDPVTENCPCGDPKWFRFRLSDGGIVHVGARTYYGYFCWSFFPEHHDGPAYFADIRQVSEPDQLKFLSRTAMLV